MNYLQRIIWSLFLGIFICASLYPYGNHGQFTDKSLLAKANIYKDQGATEWLNDLSGNRDNIISGSINEDYLWQKQLEKTSAAEKQAFIDSWLSSLPPLEQAIYRGLINALGLDKAAAQIADGFFKSYISENKKCLCGRCPLCLKAQPEDNMKKEWKAVIKESICCRLNERESC